MTAGAPDPFWREVQELFDRALQLDVSARAHFLRGATDDDRIRIEVASLLEAHESDSAFLQKPAWELIDAAEARQFVGRSMGPWRIERPIGDGGMGSVFLAVREGEVTQRAALKLVRGGHHLIQRFRQERQILAALEHPFIARFLDAGATPEGLPYLALEYVEGELITEVAGRLRTDAKLRLFLQLCDAVEYAHRNLVVHRDIKPANVLVTRDGTPKLLDFGIAKILSPGTSVDEGATRILTPDYASPEQLSGRPVSTATDVYSLGLLLFELLTGVHPFKGATRTAEAEAPKASAMRRELRGDLDTIIAAALEVDPAQRYHSVERLADDIRRYLSGHPVLARKPTFTYRASRFIRRNRVPVAAAVLALVAAAGAFVAVLQQKRIAEKRFNQVRSLARAFVFDVHDAIAPLPGSTPARELLVRRALVYLDTLASERSYDESLKVELASAYQKIGDVQGLPYSANLGDTAGALTTYRKALSICESLAGESGVEMRADLHDRIGFVEQRRLNWGPALENHDAARVLRESLPHTGRRDIALARTWAAIGDCLYQGEASLSDGGTRDAGAAYEQSLALLRDVHAPDLESERLLGIGRANQRLGGYYSYESRDLGRAIAHHDAALDALARVSALQPGNAQLRRNWADQLSMKATAQNRAGEFAGALEGTTQALEALGKFAAEDPRNVEARRDLSFARQEQARALLGLGRLADARSVALRALDEHTRLAAEVANAEDRRSLVTIYKILAEIEASARDTKRHEAWAAKAADLAARLREGRR